MKVTGDTIKFALLTTILAAGGIFAQSTPDSATAQNTPPLERKISILFDNLPLRDALSEITQKSQVTFVYSDELLRLDYRVSAKLVDKTAPEILDEILDRLPIGFVAQSRSQIVLTKKSILKEKYGTIQGQVLDGSTGEALSGANVQVLGTTLGAASDFGGFCTLRLPAAEHSLRVSVIGYEPLTRQKIQVMAGKKIYLTFRLQPTVLQMQEVQITSSRNNLPEHMEIEPSVVTVRRSQFTATPTVGEPDLFRTLQNLPGISSPNDYSNELFIRGGNSDQNLIMLDGAVVYNPYHLLGLAGAFNPDIVEQVNLSLGGFSARYGDRLSSVVDVETRAGNPEGISGFGNFSLISSKLTTAGSINSKIHWLVSARRTYHDVAARLFVGRRMPYYFYDFYGKLVYQPGPRNHFSFGGFFSRDIASEKEQHREPDIDDPGFYPDEDDIPDGTGYTSRSNDQFSWDNLVFSARWRHDFTSRLQFQLQLSQSRNPTDVGQFVSYELGPYASEATKEFVGIETEHFRSDRFRTDNHILDRTLRADWTMRPGQKHDVNFGGGYSLIRLNYFWKNFSELSDQNELVVFFDNAPENFEYRRSLRQYYFYVEDLWKITPNLSFRTGVRFEKRDFVNSWVVEPRINISYQLNQHTFVKAAYGRFHQGLATSLEKGNLQVVPLLFATDHGPSPQSADHFVIGAEADRNRWKFTAEAYYKSFNDLIQTASGAPDFETGTGHAYGLELGVKKFGDRLNLEFNYALSFSQRSFEGHEYYTSFDQRHNLAALGQYQLGKQWTFNFRWVFATGRPFTPDRVIYPERIFDPSTGEWVLGYDDDSSRIDERKIKNNARFPLYHRLDISLIKRIQKRGWALLPYIQILNTYFRWNPLYYTFESDYRVGTYKLTSVPMMPLVPTFGVSLEF